MPQGLNTVIYANGLYFEGELDRTNGQTDKNDKNGFGRLIDGNRNKWMGFWLDGKLHGYGVHVSAADRNIYMGVFRHGLKVSNEEAATDPHPNDLKGFDHQK